MECGSLLPLLARLLARVQPPPVPLLGKEGSREAA